MNGGEGRVCYVVAVAESDLAPHFINGRKGVYVRTDEFSARFEPRFADETEIRQLLDRRRAIQERRMALIARARDRFEALIGTQSTEEIAGHQSTRARIDVTIVPRFPAKRLFNHSDLLRVVAENTVPWRGTVFPGSSTGPLSQHESALALYPGEVFSLLEVNVWGMVFYAAEMEEQRSEFAGIHLYRFLGQLLVVVRYTAMILTLSRYVGRLWVSVRMRGMRGVPWVYSSSGFPEHGPSSQLDDEIQFDIEADTEELTTASDRTAANIFRYVFFATNWAGIVSNRERLEKLIREGYRFNLWGEPDLSKL